MDRPLRMISALRASSLFRKGCQGFLAYVVNEGNDLRLEDIPIVKDYPNVFPEVYLICHQKGRWSSPLIWHQGQLLSLRPLTGWHLRSLRS